MFLKKYFIEISKNDLTNILLCAILYIVGLEMLIKSLFILCLGVAQLVARYLGVVEAVGSSPVTQTITITQNALRL
jgi:membrane protein implicated in regulation of membrane protease activity